MLSKFAFIFSIFRRLFSAMSVRNLDDFPYQFCERKFYHLNKKPANRENALKKVETKRKKYFLISSHKLMLQSCHQSSIVVIRRIVCEKGKNVVRTVSELLLWFLLLMRTYPHHELWIAMWKHQLRNHSNAYTSDNRYSVEPGPPKWSITNCNKIKQRKSNSFNSIPASRMALCFVVNFLCCKSFKFRKKIERRAEIRLIIVDEKVWTCQTLDNILKRHKSLGMANIVWNFVIKCNLLKWESIIELHLPNYLRLKVYYRNKMMENEPKATLCKID